MSIRVAIVDDQALMRDGFSMILDAQPDIEVVGDAANGRLGVELCQRTRPDVVLMDIRMPVLDGIEATRLIAADENCPTRVLVLTTFDLDEYVYAAVRAGASGYLLKEISIEEVVIAVRAVHAGQSLISPPMAGPTIEPTRPTDWHPIEEKQPEPPAPVVQEQPKPVEPIQEKPKPAPVKRAMIKILFSMQFPTLSFSI
jgi:DNA-binding NarL/FixJ family response regulator